MRVRRGLEVDAPADTAWRALLDVRGLAHALSGGTVQDRPADGAWRAAFGGFAATVRVLDVDDDERVTSVHVQARRVGGGGALAATAELRAAPDGAATRVAVDADVQLAGDGLTADDVERGADALLDDLARALASEPPSRRDEAPALAPVPRVDLAHAPERERAALPDRWRALLERVLLVAAGVVAGLAVARLGRRR